VYLHHSRHVLSIVLNKCLLGLLALANLSFVDHFEHLVAQNSDLLVSLFEPVLFASFRLLINDILVSLSKLFLKNLDFFAIGLHVVAVTLIGEHTRINLANLFRLSVDLSHHARLHQQFTLARLLTHGV